MMIAGRLACSPIQFAGRPTTFMRARTYLGPARD